jgi:SOS response regulatory protein OraA/RecX
MYNLSMKKCWQYALKLLTKKDYPSFDLNNKLSLRGFSDLEIEETFQSLIKLNYLNDQRYLEGFLRYLVRRNKGPLYIKDKCQAKNLFPSDQEIDDTYTELGLDKETIITEIIAKKIQKDRIDFENLNYNQKLRFFESTRRHLMTKGFQINYIESYITSENQQ